MRWKSSEIPEEEKEKWERDPQFSTGFALTPDRCSKCGYNIWMETIYQWYRIVEFPRGEPVFTHQFTLCRRCTNPAGDRYSDSHEEKAYAIFIDLKREANED